VAPITNVFCEDVAADGVAADAAATPTPTLRTAAALATIHARDFAWANRLLIILPPRSGPAPISRPPGGVSGIYISKIGMVNSAMESLGT
jgi:hypothetical protein